MSDDCQHRRERIGSGPRPPSPPWNARRGSVRYLLEARASTCKAGCGWCCHQQVGISAPEAARILVHLRSAAVRCRSLHSIDAMAARMAAGELKPVYLETPERIYDSDLAGARPDKALHLVPEGP